MEVSKWIKVYDVIVRVVEDERLHKYGPGYRYVRYLDKFPSQEEIVQDALESSPLLKEYPSLEVVGITLVGEGYQVVKTFSSPEEIQEEKKKEEEV